jgi:hypothetical protein
MWTALINEPHALARPGLQPITNTRQRSGMGLVKLVVVCLFFIPWLSIRMVLKKAQ